GVIRWLAAALAVVAPLVVLVLYMRRGLLWVVLVALGLLALAVAAGRGPLRRDAIPERMREYPVPPPRRPYLVMNPRSGGGEGARLYLKAKAAAPGDPLGPTGQGPGPGRPRGPAGGARPGRRGRPGPPGGGRRRRPVGGGRRGRHPGSGPPPRRRARPDAA